MKFKFNTSFILIFALAIIIGFSTFSYLQTTQVSALIFNDDFPSGTEITQDMFTQIPLGAEAVRLAEDINQEQVFVLSGDLSDFLGARLRTDVLRGTLFQTNQAGTYGASSVELSLRENMVAITVPANSLTAGSPLISQGARVNIYGSFTTSTEAGLERRGSLLLFQNVSVLDVVREPSAEGETQKPEIRGVVLEVTPEQSSRLIFAAQFGSIQLALTKPGAYQNTGEILYTQNDLLFELEKRQQ